MKYLAILLVIQLSVFGISGCTSPVSHKSDSVNEIAEIEEPEPCYWGDECHEDSKVEVAN